MAILEAKSFSHAHTQGDSHFEAFDNSIATIASMASQENIPVMCPWHFALCQAPVIRDIYLHRDQYLAFSKDSRPCQGIMRELRAIKLRYLMS